MTPTDWVTLVVGLATPAGVVIAAWLNRRRDGGTGERDKSERVG